jgi:hypothetical protein
MAYPRSLAVEQADVPVQTAFQDRVHPIKGMRDRMRNAGMTTLGQQQTSEALGLTSAPDPMQTSRYALYDT